MKKLALPVLALLFASGLTIVPPAVALPADGPAPVRTKAERDAMTPEQVLQAFKEGNERFASGQMKPRDLLKEQQATAAGQHPSAVVLSCIDSRAPAEFVFDKGLGEIFNGRVAGNVVNATWPAAWSSLALSRGRSSSWSWATPAAAQSTVPSIMSS